MTNSDALVAVVVGSVVIAEWRALGLPLIGIGTPPVCAAATIKRMDRR